MWPRIWRICVYGSLFNSTKLKWELPIEDRKESKGSHSELVQRKRKRRIERQRDMLTETELKIGRERETETKNERYRSATVTILMCNPRHDSLRSVKK